MYLELNKIHENKNTTVSQLTIEGEFICFVIEDGHRDQKIHGQTRIPHGVYDIERRKHGRFYDRYKSRYKHKHVFEIVGVPNFTNIIIHTGNNSRDTKGCPLVNMGAMVGSDITGMRSRIAYQKLYKVIEKRKPKSIKIIINRN